MLAGRNQAEIILEEEKENFEEPNAVAENVDQIDSEGVRKLDIYKLMQEIILYYPGLYMIGYGTGKNILKLPPF